MRRALLGLVAGVLLVAAYGAGAQFYNWPVPNLGTLPYLFQNSAGTTKASIDAGGNIILPSNTKLCLNGSTCSLYLYSDGTSDILGGSFLTVPPSIYAPGIMLLSTQSTSGEIHASGGTLANNPFQVLEGATVVLSVTSTGALQFPQICDATATPGTPSTCNQAAGRAAFAATNTTLPITNSLVGVNSLILATLQTTDGTCTAIKSVVPTTNTITINVNAACAGTANVGWMIGSK